WRCATPSATKRRSATAAASSRPDRPRSPRSGPSAASTVAAGSSRPSSRLELLRGGARPRRHLALVRLGEDEAPEILEFAALVVGDRDPDAVDIAVQHVRPMRGRLLPARESLVELVIAGADILRRVGGVITAGGETRREAAFAR